MGWFSRKKKIYVSSVVYNLAGGPEDRVKYIASTIATKVISNSQFSMSETLQSALLGGPGMRMRRFGQWARSSGYASTIGQTAGRLTVGSSLNLNDIIGQIPADPGTEVTIQDAKIGEADYGAWADQWMLENHPDQVDADYEIDFEELTNTIFIRFPDNNPVYQFHPVGFDPLSPYLYVGYTLSAINQLGPVVEGPLVLIDNPSEFPSIIGWDSKGTTVTPTTTDLKTTVLTEVTYSDSTPPETSTDESTRPGSYNTTAASYEKTEYQGQNPDGTELTSLASFMFQMQMGTIVPTTSTTTEEETLPGDVIKTTTVTTTVENIVMRLAYRIDTQSIIDKTWSVLQTLIYRKGDGNAVFDAMFSPTVANSTFLPFIPIRLDNVMISPSYLPHIYNLNLKALKRATGSDYDDLVTSLQVNPSLRDIDYAYITLGVALNTKENASKKYIYKFFQTMLLNSGGGVGEYNNWRTQWQIADQSQRNWLSWKTAQADPTNPLYGRPEPSRQPYPAPWGNQLSVYSASMNYDMRVHWASLEEKTFTGEAWVGAKQGQLRIRMGATIVYEQLVMSGGEATWITEEHEAVEIVWQDSPTTYRIMGIQDLWHVNMIYRGKAVYTGAAEALNDPEESGFIIPMHEGIFRGMSLVDTSQMSMASGYMVLNCYKVVKQKWYQTSWFKIILVIIVIVITVLSSGTGAGSAGLLGTAASVGAALGFVGAVAIIVGTIANAVAAMLLTQLLTMGATALFGEKVGMIVGAIASIIAINVGTGVQAGQSLSASMAGMANAENIMRLTVAAGKGIAGYIDDATQATVNSTQELLAEYGEAKSEIERLWEQNLGFGNAVIDPTVLTDVTKTANFIPESSDVFLSRTLMTGSDIADLTNSMITNFAAMTTSTTLPS